jgi:hypothetical protein
MKKDKIWPKRPEYVTEVQQRAAILFVNNPLHIPKANNWSITRSVKWLESNPLEDSDNLLFLKNEVNKLRNVTFSTLAEEAIATVDAPAAKKWRGSAPYMRLIMCLVDDDVKASYVRHADTMTREVLDARNSDVQPPSEFELLANTALCAENTRIVQLLPGM